MNDFLFGALAMASLVAGLYFFKFWKKTRDRFFLFFACSFFIEAVHRGVLSFIETPEDAPFAFPYLMRLSTFLLILFAIVDKNRKTLRSKNSSE